MQRRVLDVVVSLMVVFIANVPKSAPVKEFGISVEN